jgi:hypothetical protein
VNWFAYVNNDPVNWVDLWGLSANENPQQRPASSLAQNDPALADIPHMALEGCNFRTYQSVAEFETGLFLTADEIRDSVKVLQSTPNRANPSQMAVDGDLRVNNPDQVVNDAFARLGSPNITGTAGYGQENNQAPDYYQQWGTTPRGGRHSVLLDSNGSLLNDPFYPDINLTNTSQTPIYLH